MKQLSIPIFLFIFSLCMFLWFMLLPEEKLLQEEKPLLKEHHVEASTKWIAPGQRIFENIRFGGIIEGTTGSHYQSFTLSIEDHNFEGIPSRYFFMDSHHGTLKMVSKYRTYTLEVEEVDLKKNRIKISATEH